MTRLLIRAVRASVAWLTQPTYANPNKPNIPLCVEVWLNHSVRTASDRDNPPKRSTIHLNPVWMVQPC